ncbi:MAG: B12-binding domain-containing radical SAM protein, partial [Candidatus Omnitrophica bacterium]|nr:B12-binding domain-containing radical SAM protein [Candidatus Omnitrophota bacterium]
MKLFNKKISKVALVFPTGKALKGRPHQCEPPMGLAYLAAEIRSDFDVKIIDGRTKFQIIKANASKWEYFGFSPQEILEQISTYAPDVVGVTCLSSSHYPEVLNLCKLIKKNIPDIIIVIGGSHPTFFANEIMNQHTEIDFIVLGEGEETFHRLLLSIKTDSDYTALDGLAFRSNNAVFINPKTKYIRDLDALSFPAIDLLPLKFYRKKGALYFFSYKSETSANLLTSRGCTLKCSFCSMRNFWGNIYRSRSAENVLDEIEERVKKFGIEDIHFIDDNLTFDQKRAKQIFKGIIDRGIKTHWAAPCGVAYWTIDDEMLELMRASGCYALNLAFESGDKEVLNKIIKKPFDPAYGVKLVEKMKKLGIMAGGFFMLGFPGETKQQMLKTFEFAHSANLDRAYFFIVSPTPGSELYHICKDKGCIKEDFSFDDLEYGVANMDTEHFSKHELEEFVAIHSNIYY